MTDVYDIHFELSNEDRVSILKTLVEESVNLTKLSNRLGLKNQETSRHLSRLENAGLVVKAPDGTFKTSLFGEICLSKDDELSFLVDNREYFNTHKVNGIPSDLFAKIGVLANSSFINDTLISLQIAKRIIEEAEEHLYRLSDQFMMMLLDPIVDAAERGVDYNLIYSASIHLPPDATETVRLRGARDKGNFHSYTHQDVKAYMVVSEKEAFLAFRNVNGKYDYMGFNSTDEGFLRWCRELYMTHHRNKMPPKPLWDGIPRT